MMNADRFAARQLQLTGAFGKYVFDHPEVDDLLPQGAQVYFEVDGNEEFNRVSRRLAESQSQKERATVVLVRVKGLAPPQGSRLIEPEMQLLPPVRPKWRKATSVTGSTKSRRRS
jgi:hypothetical protein